MDSREREFELDLTGSDPELPQEFCDKQYIRVYLASALTGREVDRDFDDRVRGAIKEVLSKVTLHRVPYLFKYQVYDPAEFTSPGSTHEPKEVYYIDFKELVSSDFALFYLNAASLGMGIERQVAAMASIPSSRINRKESEVSRMFQGAFGDSLFKLEFDAIDELTFKLGNAIARSGPELLDKAIRRRQVIGMLKDHKTPRRIFRKRVSLNISIETLARETGIQPFWWEKVQRDESGLLAASTFTPMIFFQLAEILQGRWETSEEGIPSFCADSGLRQTQKASLDNLYDAYVCRETPLPDELLLSLWQIYQRQIREINKNLWENDKVVSKEEWIVSIDEHEKAYRKEHEKDRLVQVLGLNIKELKNPDSSSLDSLTEILADKTRLSDQTIIRLWKHYKKNVKKKKAARSPSSGEDGNLRQYSVEDWRDLFNLLHLND